MRLYYTECGRWVGTTAEAKRLGHFEKVEVPTKIKDEFILWLNEREDGNAFTDTPIAETVGPKPAPDRSEIAELQGGFDKAIKLEDEIAAADLPNSIRFASHALSRVQEHLNAAKGGAL